MDGDVVVATCRSTYRDAVDGPVTSVFENCFVIRFDQHGRCREFTEYYMKRPAGRLTAARPGASDEVPDTLPSVRAGVRRPGGGR